MYIILYTPHKSFSQRTLSIWMQSFYVVFLIYLFLILWVLCHLVGLIFFSIYERFLKKVNKYTNTNENALHVKFDLGLRYTHSILPKWISWSWCCYVVVKSFGFNSVAKFLESKDWFIVQINRIKTKNKQSSVCSRFSFSVLKNGKNVTKQNRTQIHLNTHTQQTRYNYVD